MKVLVKIGGTLLDAEESRTRIAKEISALRASGVELVVVHGGGKQMTQFLASRGVESRFVRGLRVTTAEVLDAVLKVLAGTVNKELVAAFVAAGVPAVGLSGMDGLLTEAELISDELGYVGRPVRSNPDLLRVLSAAGYLPVIACVAGDRNGRFYNVNADQMAVACAAGWQANRLLFLTDVDGVRGKDMAVLPVLTPREGAALIEEEVATGGMRAKLEAAMDALSRNIAEVIIAPGAVPGILDQLMSGARVGTRLIEQNMEVASERAQAV